MSENTFSADHEAEKQMNNVEHVMSNIDSNEQDEVLKDFDVFRDFLSKRIRKAETMGMSEEQIVVTAQRAANYLSQHEEPRNAEEQLLKELWKIGREEEKHMLAHMLVRLAQNNE